MQLQTEKLEQQFSERLRKLRGKFSQAEFCRFLGLSSQATYARYEAGRIPSGEVLLQMASRIGITVDELLTGKDPRQQPDLTDFPMMQRITGAHFSPPSPSPSPSNRGVPMLGFAQGGEPIDLTLPPDEQTRVPTDLREPSAFALTLRGDSMNPFYAQGDIIIVDPSERARPEHLVVAQIKHEGACFKLLNYPPNKDVVRLSSYNSSYPSFDRHHLDFDWIYPVHAIIKPVFKYFL